jgi:hypothetical protein
VTATRRPIIFAGDAAVGILIVFAGLLAGTGWLYLLRGLHWLDVGPRIADSLPLLQLAATDAQPLLRVMVAWVLAGVLTGVALVQMPPRRRAGFALGLGLVVLLLQCQAAYALARNLPLSGVLFSRSPGLGPALEGLAFGLGCWLPRAGSGRQGRHARRRSFISIVSGFDDRHLRGGQDRDAAQDHGDRQQVSERRTGASA